MENMKTCVISFSKVYQKIDLRDALRHGEECRKELITEVDYFERENKKYFVISTNKTFIDSLVYFLPHLV